MLPLLMLIAAAPVVQVDAGPLTVRVHASRSAQLFHVVDQLSGWTPFAHRQYRELGLVGDEGLLAEHAALRKRVGYGVLEPHFYADGSVADALASAAKDPKLTAADVETERKVLTAFEPKLRKFLEQRAPVTDGFAQRLVKEKAALTVFANRAAKFLGSSGARVEVFVIPSPGSGSGGGGFNGGVLTVETVEGQAPLDVLLHECWHAIAEPRAELLRQTAHAAEMDYETLSEGLAYAVAPGIYRHADDRGDQLSRNARRDLEKSFFEDPIVRFNRYGLALRPTLLPALDASALDAYLPTAVAVFQGLKAVFDPRTDRAFFVFPIEGKPLAQTLADKGDAWARGFDAASVESVAKKVRPQDVIVLLVTPGATEKVSAPLVELLGPEWDAKKLPKAGEVTLTRGRARAVVVLAASIDAAIARAATLDL